MPLHEIERLRKELAKAREEIAALRLQLDNVVFLLRTEMAVSSKFPKGLGKNGGNVSN